MTRYIGESEFRHGQVDRAGVLLVISQRQCPALQAALDERVPGGLAMRYGCPAIRDALAALRQAGVRRRLVLARCPQYSATSTASVLDAVVDKLKTWRWPRELRCVNPYGNHAGYIHALRKHDLESDSPGHRCSRGAYGHNGIPSPHLSGEKKHPHGSVTGCSVAQLGQDL
jgi:protoheme ferro-lyase